MKSLLRFAFLMSGSPLVSCNSLVSEYTLADSRLSSLIEPFMIVLIGGMVAVMVIALYMPMFDLGTVVR